MLQQLSHVSARLVSSGQLGGEVRQIAQKTEDTWPENRPVECSTCGACQAPGPPWECQKCKTSTFWGIEKKICPCGSEVMGQRNGWRINWFACAGCNPEAAERKAKIEKHRKKNEATEKSKFIRLRVQREAAADCLSKQPNCKVRKRSNPQEKFCGACKGGIDL